MGTLRKTYWTALLTYIWEYVDKTEIIKENDLEPRCRRLYHAMKIADSQRWSIMKEIHRDLKEGKVFQAIDD